MKEKCCKNCDFYNPLLKECNKGHYNENKNDGLNCKYFKPFNIFHHDDTVWRIYTSSRFFNGD